MEKTALRCLRGPRKNLRHHTERDHLDISTKEECARRIRADYQGHVRRQPYQCQLQARENDRLESKGGTPSGISAQPSPLVLLDVIARGIDSRLPFVKLFADDLVIIDEDPKRLELMLEKGERQWKTMACKTADKTTFLKTAENPHIITLGAQSIPETNTFKYLGSTVDKTCDTSVDVERRIQSGWKNWRKLTVYSVTVTFRSR